MNIGRRILTIYLNPGHEVTFSKKPTKNDSPRSLRNEIGFPSEQGDTATRKISSLLQNDPAKKQKKNISFSGEPHLSQEICIFYLWASHSARTPYFPIGEWGATWFPLKESNGFLVNDSFNWFNSIMTVAQWKLRNSIGLFLLEWGIRLRTR